MSIQKKTNVSDESSQSLSLQGCDELNTIIKDWKYSYYKRKAEKAATKATIKTVLKWGAKMIPKVGAKAVPIVGAVVDFLTPSDIGLNSDVYGKALDKINNLLSQETLDEAALRKEIENLKIASNGIKIEAEWGNKPRCYNLLDKHTIDVINSVNQELNERKPIRSKDFNDGNVLA